MSEQQKRDRQIEPLLDWEEELKAMAAEVPEMPESFTEGWRNAIRAEAAKRETEEGRAVSKAKTTENEVPAAVKADAVDSWVTRNAKEDESPVAEKRTEAKIIRVRRWTAALSTAAVAVFLLGGTLLTGEKGFMSRNSATAPMSEMANEAVDYAPESFADSVSAVSEEAAVLSEPSPVMAREAVEPDATSPEESGIMAMSAVPRAEEPEAESADSAMPVAYSAREEAAFGEEDTPADAAAWEEPDRTDPEEKTADTADEEAPEDAGTPGFFGALGRFAGRTWPGILGFLAIVGAGLTVWTKRVRKTEK